MEVNVVNISQWPSKSIDRQGITMFIFIVMMRVVFFLITRIVTTVMVMVLGVV